MAAPSSDPSNPPTPPGASRPVASAGSAVTIVRRYPKPPAFFPRFLMLCLRPESWAEAARYPTYITFLPLLVAILLGATIMATGDTLRLVQSLDTFAAQYDKNGYPELHLDSTGTLSSSQPLAAPIRAQLQGVPFFSEAVINIDPTGKTAPEAIKALGFFITDKEFVGTSTDGPTSRGKLASILPYYDISLPATGQTLTLNSTTLTSYFADHQVEYYAGIIFVSAAYALVLLLWCALSIFMFSPLIMMVASGLPSESAQRRLILPRRAAVRMIAGLLVPVILLDAILRATGNSVSQLLGFQWSATLWIAACAALAIWSAIMANRMYGPKAQTRRAQ